MAVEIIDLSNYRDRNGSRVPEGDYLVELEEIEVGKSSKGDPMWTVFFRIVGGEHDGQTIVDRVTQTERAMFRVVAFLQGMGIKTQRKRMKVDLDRLVGKKVRVQLADGEPYNGTIRSEVKGYTRFVSSKSTPTGDDFEGLDSADEEVSEEAPAASAQPASEPAEGATSEDMELDLDDLDI